MASYLFKFLGILPNSSRLVDWGPVSWNRSSVSVRNLLENLVRRGLSAEQDLLCIPLGMASLSCVLTEGVRIRF